MRVHLLLFCLLAQLIIHVLAAAPASSFSQASHPSTSAGDAKNIFASFLSSWSDPSSSSSSSSSSVTQFFESTFEQSVLLTSRDRWDFYSTRVEDDQHGTSKCYDDRFDSAHYGRPTFDLNFDESTLSIILDTSGSAFTDIRESSFSTTTRLTSSDIKLVKRVLAKDDEYWSAVYPLEKVPNTTRIDSQFLMTGVEKHGFTLVVNRMNYRYSTLAELCNLFTQQLFGFRTSLNLYLTPFESNGFETHFDWQESFVLQLDSIKYWSIYPDAMIKLPRQDQKFKPKREVYEKMRKQVHTLNPGSFLYFPSGVLHEATTNITLAVIQVESTGWSVPLHPGPPISLANAAPSMHLTLGVEIDPLFTYQGLIHILLDQTLERSAETYRDPLLGKLSSFSSSVDSSCSLLGDSDLIYLDLMHWKIFSLASRTNSSIAGSAPQGHAYRRSLWGLHLWSRSSLSHYSLYIGNHKFMPPPRKRTLAQLLLEEPDNGTSSAWRDFPSATRQTIAFEVHVARQLLPLLLAVQDIDLRELIRELQAHHNRAVFSASPLFSDEILLPFMTPIFEDPTLIAMLDNPECNSVLDRIQMNLRELQQDWLMKRVSIQNWQREVDTMRSQEVTDSTSTPLTWSSFFSYLTLSLDRIHTVLLSSRASHLAEQTAHVKENTRRQEAYRRGNKCCRL